MPESSQQFSRWYEKYYHIHQFLELSESLAPTVQRQLAHQFGIILEEYRPLFEQAETLAGNEESAKIFDHLKLSLKKNRWYDKISEFRTNIDLLLFLPDETLREIDEKCGVLFYKLKLHGYRNAQDSKAFSN